VCVRCAAALTERTVCGAQVSPACLWLIVTSWCCAQRRTCGPTVCFSDWVWAKYGCWLETWKIQLFGWWYCCIVLLLILLYCITVNTVVLYYCWYCCTVLLLILLYYIIVDRVVLYYCWQCCITVDSDVLYYCWYCCIVLFLILLYCTVLLILQMWYFLFIKISVFSTNKSSALLLKIVCYGLKNRFFKL
jgi:hypothetical protein